MGLKRNFIYNSLLTVASYISTLIVFPYVSRVLGVENIGVVNYVDNIINYFILLSNLGINAVGVREIAAHKANNKELSVVFTSLCKILVFTTFLAMIVFALSFFFVPKLSAYKPFLGIGLFKLFFSVFLIDWFYKGLEQFDYVTKRTILIKCLYIVLVFLFVRKQSDYLYYYGVTTFTIVLNSFVNWRKVLKIFPISLNSLRSRSYIKPMVSMGAYLILNSLYSTFNVLYLGWVCGTTEVAYYTTAFNVYLIISAFFTAFTGVMIPRMSSLLSENKLDDFRVAIKESCNITVAVCLPLTVYCICEAANIIQVLTGSGFEGAIVPMQLINVLICINGLSQIIVLQILLPMKKDKVILVGSLMAAVLALLLDVILVERFGALGSSIVLIAAVILSNVVPWYYVMKNKLAQFDVKYSFIQILLSVPYVVICLIGNLFVKNSFIALAITSLVSVIYFFVINLYLFKNELIISLIPTKVRNCLIKQV